MEKAKAKICVPVCVRQANELANALTRAADVADVVEIRFDCFAKDELADAIEMYVNLRPKVSIPFIVTFRPDDDGGCRTINSQERVSFWDQIGHLWNSDARFASDLADVEVQFLLSSDWKNQIIPERIICSYHQTSPTIRADIFPWHRPTLLVSDMSIDLSKLYSGMRRVMSDLRNPVPDGEFPIGFQVFEVNRPASDEPAQKLKIAASADDAVDCLPVFDLLDWARRNGDELTALAMGQAGLATRILGPSRGSSLTYASLDEHSATAPGQLTARELREIYRIDSIDSETEIIGIIGWPVAHSISPHVHNAAFAQADINAVFIPIEVHDLDAFVGRIVRTDTREIDWNLRGLAVTAPYKTAVMKHLDWIEPVAQGIGAVNTIVFRGAELHGYNTDAGGFIEPLKQRLESLEGLRCGVIGAGGAARAVAKALLRKRAMVELFARNPDRAKAITSDFGIECRSLADAKFNGFDVVVNATPLGTRGEFETGTPVTAKQLRGVRLAYDLVYNPLETQFLREAREAGCESIGGLEMLIAQAVEQFRLWTAKVPDLEVMRDAAMRALNNSGL